VKFTDLQSVALDLTPDQLEASLREMTRDPRFGAILRLLYDHRQQLISAGAAPLVAAGMSAGTVMAHYLGGVDAIMAIEARLFGICEEAELKRVG